MLQIETKCDIFPGNFDLNIANRKFLKVFKDKASEVKFVLIAKINLTKMTLQTKSSENTHEQTSLLICFFV